MSRPTAFGAVCEHGRLARKCERCDDAEEIASLRDRLRIMAPMVCEGCGCAAASRELCWDCYTAQLSCVIDGWSQDSSHGAACISVGLRALCGRRILEGCWEGCARD